MPALQAQVVRVGPALGVESPRFAPISVLQWLSSSLTIYPHWHVLAADGFGRPLATASRSTFSSRLRLAGHLL
jgi:hypothetical protein